MDGVDAGPLISIDGEEGKYPLLNCGCILLTNGYVCFIKMQLNLLEECYYKDWSYAAKIQETTRSED